MYVSVLVDVCLHDMYAWCLRRLEGCITSPELVLMNCCEPLCGCQESSSGPLKGNKFSYLLSHLSRLGDYILYASLTAFSFPALCEPSYSAIPCPPALTDISNPEPCFFARLLSDSFSWYKSCCNTVPSGENHW